MNITGVEQAIGVNIHTLRKWEKDFNIKIARDKKNQRIYSDKDIKIFQAIKSLRDADNGINTIQRKLTLDGEYIQLYKLKDNNNNTFSDIAMSRINILESKIISTIDNKIDTLTDMSEKLSRASFEIGKLQAEKVGLEEKLKLISDSSNKDMFNLNKDLEKQRLENEQLKAENEVLKAKLSLPWWKKIFN